MEETQYIVGTPSPHFLLDCVNADGQLGSVSSSEFAGRWLILLFYPRDFSMVCPTELSAFSGRMPEFTQRGCSLVGISVDSVERHQEWVTTPADQGGIGLLQFPLATDESGALAHKLHSWNTEKRVALRGLFIIDPQGIIQYSVVHNLNVGRSVDEALRVIDGLQSGGLCPVSWTKADGTIDVEEALQPGRVLGHYRIRQQLGRGTFGTVFEAWDEWLQREVAIKILRERPSCSRQTLLFEARAAARLQHPNIAGVFSIETEAGLPLIVMERIHGECLCDLISSGLPEELQRKIVIGVGRGLAAAHAKGTAHGDLKPANVLVLRDGTPKLLDFGLSRITRRHALEVTSPTEAAIADASLTPEDAEGMATEETTIFQAASAAVIAADETGNASASSVIRGTPRYMAPEQFNGQPASMQTDVFSFGLMLYELLTGQKALPGNSFADLLKQVRDPELPRRLSRSLPEEFQNLLGQTLAGDPAERPTMESVLEQLERQPQHA